MPSPSDCGGMRAGQEVPYLFISWEVVSWNAAPCIAQARHGSRQAKLSISIRCWVSLAISLPFLSALRKQIYLLNIYSFLFIYFEIKNKLTNDTTCMEGIAQRCFVWQRHRYRFSQKAKNAKYTAEFCLTYTTIMGQNWSHRGYILWIHTVWLPMEPCKRAAECTHTDGSVGIACTIVIINREYAHNTSLKSPKANLVACGLELYIPS